MPHPIIFALPEPLHTADPLQIQEALNELMTELEMSARGQLRYDPIEDRISRVEAFTLLSTVHTANVADNRSTTPLRPAVPFRPSEE